MPSTCTSSVTSGNAQTIRGVTAPMVKVSKRTVTYAFFTLNIFLFVPCLDLNERLIDWLIDWLTYKLSSVAVPESVTCEGVRCSGGKQCALKGNGRQYSCVTDPASDPCSPNPCQNGGICNSNSGGFTCSCASGYTGDDCSTNGMMDCLLVSLLFG